MREILFRGQTRRYGEKVRMDGTKLPGKWVYGGIFPGEGDHSIIYGWKFDTEQSAKGIAKYPVYSDTVGQYTGLTDKNGLKIFEGDIICAVAEDTNEKLFATVNFGEYDDANALENDHFVGWFLSFRVNGGIVNVSILNGKSDNMLAIKMSEVIGNIYDNPELLEEETHGLETSGRRKTTAVRSQEARAAGNPG